MEYFLNNFLSYFWSFLIFNSTTVKSFEKIELRIWHSAFDYRKDYVNKQAANLALILSIVEKHIPLKLILCIK